MSKVTTYLCDCCVIVYPFDELEAVQVYVFGQLSENDPKQVDYEHICPDCRAELLNLLNMWLGKNKAVNKEVKDDVEVVVEEVRGVA